MVWAVSLPSPKQTVGKQIPFMGYQRQSRFLDSFRKMKPAAQDAMRDIYAQAHQGPNGVGRHVIMAMVSAVRHPDLFRFTLANILVRFSLKRATVNGDSQRAILMQEVLDDFHAALDEFMGRAKQTPDGSSDGKRQAPAVIRELDAFKNRVRPALEQVKAAGRRSR